jgi:hypothetical protein
MSFSINRNLILSTFLILFLFYGCGYYFRADGQPIGIDIDSLAIPMFSSSSSKPGFEADFTRIIREEFLSNSQIPIVPREKARFVLLGNIYHISSDPVAFDVEEQIVGGRAVTYSTTSMRRSRMRLDVILKDRTTGKVIWNEKAMTAEANFDVGPDPLENRYNEQLALEKIAGILSSRIYLKTMERF